MNFQQLLSDLVQANMSHKEIADACGLASRGHVYDILTGRQKSVRYEVGVQIIDVHRRKMQLAKRRKVPAILQKQE